jgi:hypothetical protein
VTPGVLRDFDIPDLARLAATKTQIWIDPIDGLGRALGQAGASKLLIPMGNLHVVTTANGASADLVRHLTNVFH